MSNKKLIVIPQKVQDEDLIKWLSAESDDVREIIVEAMLPDRKVTMRKREDGISVPADMISHSPSDRKKVMRKLNLKLKRILDEPPVPLKAAGALAIRANNKQVLKFLDHPLVKFIRPNRRIQRK